ncbi:hypothetical protein [Halioxenophilus sp. WMMB6]|uniref:hypothetical protein n=1 Tax=Halioxenophilus sp. WMMB6 TaxID=3073815 RepID=UPI00295F06B8|nr:hypothetical protein [Halioxenophilus sp. WMMB6]
MKREDVPQDGATSTYGGERKLLYAVDANGDVVGVPSAGWEVESEATQSALDLIAEQCDAAWARAQQGTTSPLEYYMYYRRMDVALLAQTSGVWQWRIRRHFNPQRFQKLGRKLLARYEEALGLTIAELQTLPEQPLHESSTR